MSGGGRLMAGGACPPSLEIRERDDPDGALRVTLLGEIDIAVVDDLATRLSLLRRFQRRVRLDLSELRFIDCGGVNAILRALAEARGVGWELEVDRIVSPCVERIALLAGAASALWPAEATTA